MPSQRLWAVFRAWIWLIVPSVVLGAVIAFVIAYQSPLVYTSTIRLLVGTPITGNGIGINDVLVDQALAQTYADLATTKPLLTRAIAEANVPTGADDLADHVSARVPTDSSLVEVDVSYTDPAGSASLANAIGDQLLGYPPDNQGKGFGSNVSLTVVDPAIPPKTPEGTRLYFSTGLGAAIGLLLALALAFLVENVRAERRESRDRRAKMGLADSGSSSGG